MQELRRAVERRKPRGGGGGECPFCHRRYTVARSTDGKAKELIRDGEIKLELCDFDGAREAFIKATEHDKTESQAYWGMALAEFKVQYIKDFDANGEPRLQPVCHDISEKVFSASASYKTALKYATDEQRAEYVKYADEIDYIHKQFFRLKSSGLDYDCFICVKVSDGDDKTKKTRDSDLANDLYYHLRDKGLRPFYSERDIQNETGADYEARILYALHSANSMIIVCSDESYLQTRWVKNEYTRFLELIGYERKESDAITIAFSGAPVERLPGKRGAIQGVCLDKPDAYNKLDDFVLAHKTLEAPTISRKSYGDATVEKRSAIRSQVVKRTLGKFEKTTITVSEQAKLDTARDMIESGNFAAAIARCDGILQTNASCSDAYKYKFLAKNGCKNFDAFIASTRNVTDFSDLESAIATGDKTQKSNCYTALYERAMKRVSLSDYAEYISLPDSPQEKIDALTDAYYKYILGSGSASGMCSLFDEIIKTVTNTDRFIAMNIGIAEKLFKANGELAAKYYKKVLEVDPANEQALWFVFVLEKGLYTGNDNDGTNDKIAARKLIAMLSNDEGRAQIERGLFSFGFNKYAHKRIFDICAAELKEQKSQAAAGFDFLLSMIPSKNQKDYSAALQTITVKALAIGLYDVAAVYNDRAIGEDKLNDKAYYYRMCIKKRTAHPIAFTENPEALLDDPDFSAAMDAYAERNRGKQNVYITFVNKLKEMSSQIDRDVCRFVCTYYDLTDTAIDMGIDAIYEEGILPKGEWKEIFNICKKLPTMLYVENENYEIANIRYIMIRYEWSARDIKRYDDSLKMYQKKKHEDFYTDYDAKIKELKVREGNKREFNVSQQNAILDIYKSAKPNEVVERYDTVEKAYDKFAAKEEFAKSKTMKFIQLIPALLSILTTAFQAVLLVSTLTRDYRTKVGWLFPPVPTAVCAGICFAYMLGSLIWTCIAYCKKPNNVIYGNGAIIAVMAVLLLANIGMGICNIVFNLA